MAIKDKVIETSTITKGWRALELFTDRDDLIKFFLNYIQVDPPAEKILVFQGDGGHGKSLLLRFLQQYCCRKFTPSEWEKIKTKSKKELHTFLISSKNHKGLPFAELNFESPARGEDNPQDPFSGLLMLRRDLSKFGLKFPLFDFACVWYLKQTNKLTDENTKKLFPEESIDLITGVIDVINHTGVPIATIAKQVMNLFNKQLKNDFTVFMAKRGISKVDLEIIQKMDYKRELIEELPVLFAKDLNANLQVKNAPERIILFFDSHEALWGTQRDPDEHKRDEWLRCLLRNIEFKDGIVAVVLGRYFPRWNKAQNYNIPDEYVHIRTVDFLSISDAKSFLTDAGVSDYPIQDKFITYAEVEKNRIHPYYLGLCADVALSAKRNGETISVDNFPTNTIVANKGQELVDKLLKYEDRNTRHAIKSLAACRSFNEDLYFELAKKLKFSADKSSFELLKQFSFVWHSPKGEGWYRIHDLLRKLFYENKEEITYQSHKILAEYYNKKSKPKGEVSSIIEAIYHTNQINWSEGLEQWISLFNEVMLAGRTDICRNLLDIRNELIVPEATARAYLSYVESSFYFYIRDFDETFAKCRETIKQYDNILAESPLLGSANWGRALTMYILSNSQAFQLNYNLAKKNVLEANKYLEIAYKSKDQQFLPEFFETIFNSFADQGLKQVNEEDLKEYLYNLVKIQGLILLGELEIEENQPDNANHFLNEALKNCNILAKTTEKTDPFINNAIATALHSIGKIHSLKEEFEQALMLQHEALKYIDKALENSNNELISLLLLKVRILISLGYLNLLSSDTAENKYSFSHFRTAIDTGNKAIDNSVDFADAFKVTAEAYEGIASWYTKAADYKSAEVAYKDALVVYDDYLTFIPHPEVDNYKQELIKKLEDVKHLNINQNYGHLLVNTSVVCDVYINDTLLGVTPISKENKNNSIPIGKHTINVIPKDTAISKFTETIVITPKTFTLLDIKFSQNEKPKYILLYFVQANQKVGNKLIVKYTPGRAQIYLDENLLGDTPLQYLNPSEGVHTLSLRKNGVELISLRININTHYDLYAKIKLDNISLTQS